MATPTLDISIIAFFRPIFVFLFIFAVLFAILEKTKIFGSTKGVNSLISFVLALLFLISSDLVEVVNIITPWFTILFIMILMMILVFMFASVKQETIAETFKQTWFVWILVLVMFGIFGYALSQVFGSQIQAIYGGTEGAAGKGIGFDIGRIIFHPKILGVILIIAIAAQAVRLISKGL